VSEVNDRRDSVLPLPARSGGRYGPDDAFPQGCWCSAMRLQYQTPIYGQGMTVAALEATALRTAWRTGTAIEPRFFAAA